jgi:large subunit ribosomal protein L14
MVQFRTTLVPADNTGAKKLQIIHLKGGSRRYYSGVGDLVLAVVKDAIPYGMVSKKQKVSAVIVRTKKEYRRKDGSYIRFDDNAAVIVDEQGNPMGSRIFGPIAREIREKGFTKIASLAKEMI